MREPALDGHVAHGGHAARERRHLLLPALHAVQDRVGWISRGALDYICRAWRAAGRGLRRRHVLPLLLDSRRGRRRGPRLRRHRLPAAMARTTCARLDRSLGRPAGRRRRRDWERSPCLGHVRSGAGRAAARSPRASRRRCAWRRRRSERRGPAEAPVDRRRAHEAAGIPPAAIASPQSGDPRLRLLARVGRGRSRRASTRTGPAAATWRCARAFELGPGGGDRARSPPPSCWAAAAPRSRPGENGRRWRQPQPARTTSCATPTSPSRARSRTAC